LKKIYYEYANSLFPLLVSGLSDADLIEELATALVQNSLFSLKSISDFSEDGGFADGDNGPARSMKARATPDILAAKFIRHVKKDDTRAFNALVNLAQLGVVCRLGRFFGAPPPQKRAKTSLRLFLDSPFLLDALGFCGKERLADADLVLKQSRSLGVEIYLFPHSLDEAQQSIRGLLRTEAPFRFGPTSTALRNGQISIAMLDAFIRTPDDFVQALEIKTLKYSEVKRLQKANESFNVDDWNALYAKLSTWNNEAARKIDADSVAFVQRLRVDDVSTDPLQSKAIMLSSNPQFVRLSKSVLDDRGLVGSKQVGPVMSRFEYAAVLWLNSDSSNRIKIASHQIMSASEDFLNQDRNLIEQVQRYAESVSQERKQLIDAIVQNPVSYEMLQEITQNRSELLEESTFDNIIERIGTSAQQKGQKLERDKANLVQRDLREKIAISKEQIQRSEAERLAALVDRRDAMTNLEIANQAKVALAQEVQVTLNEKTNAFHSISAIVHTEIAEMERRNKFHRTLVFFVLGIIAVLGCIAGYYLSIAAKQSDWLNYLWALVAIFLTAALSYVWKIVPKLTSRLSEMLMSDKLLKFNNNMPPAVPSIEVIFSNGLLEFKNINDVLDALKK
jgi:hypothetical protein